MFMFTLFYRFFKTFCKLISKMFNVNNLDKVDILLKVDTEKKKNDENAENRV